MFLKSSQGASSNVQPEQNSKNLRSGSPSSQVITVIVIITTTAAITSISPSLTITYALPPGHSGAC